MIILNKNKSGFTGQEVIVNAALNWARENPGAESGNLGAIEISSAGSVKRPGPGFSNDSGPSL